MPLGQVFCSVPKSEEKSDVLANVALGILVIIGNFSV